MILSAHGPLTSPQLLTVWLAVLDVGAIFGRLALVLDLTCELIGMPPSIPRE